MSRIIKITSVIILLFSLSTVMYGCTKNNKHDKNIVKEESESDLEKIKSSGSIRIQGSDYLFKAQEFKNDDGSILYWNIDIQKDNEEIQKITINADGASTVKPDIKRLIQLQDVNFDGKEDLLVWKGNYGVSNASCYICYLCTEDDMYPFKVMEGFELVLNPSIDNEKKLILSSSRENANTYDYTTYKVDDNKLIKDLSLEVVHKENTLSDCTLYKYDEDEKSKVREEKDINFQERYTKDGYFDIGSISWISFGNAGSCTDNQCD